MRLTKNIKHKLKLLMANPLQLIGLVYGPIDRFFCFFMVLFNTIRYRRNKQIFGPIRLDHLPYAIQNEFKQEFELFQSLDAFKRWATNGRDKCIPEQVPEICHSYMPYINGNFSKIWPREMVDKMIQLTINQEDFSCEVYPRSVCQYFKALKNRFFAGKRALVIGSISPWIESILLGKGVTEVHTLEYHQLTCDHPQIKTHQNKHVTSFPVSFDIACSFSSIEHSGLGRYGDQIDPKGDIKAMDEIYDLLVPGGIALVGVPIGESNLIDSNRCRIYSKEYVEDKLFERFELIDAVPFPYESGSLNYSGHDWQNQPLYVLQKPN